MNEILLELALSCQKGKNIEDNIYNVIQILVKKLPLSYFGLWAKNAYLSKKNNKNIYRNYTFLTGNVDYRLKNEQITLPENITDYFKSENSYVVVTRENPDFTMFFERNNAPAMIIFVMGKHLFFKILLEHTLQSEHKTFLTEINPIIKIWKNTLKKHIKLEILQKENEIVKQQNQKIIQKIRGYVDNHKKKTVIEDENAEKMADATKIEHIEEITNLYIKGNPPQNLIPSNINLKKNNFLQDEKTHDENIIIEKNKMLQKFLFEEKQNKIFELWLTQLQDPLCVVDCKGNILFVNNKATDFFGHTLEYVLYKNITELSTTFKNQTEWNIFSDYLQKKKTVLYETVHITPKGRIYPLEVYAQYIDLNLNITPDQNQINLEYFKGNNPFENNEFIIFTGKDITDRQTAQNIILKKQIQLSAFINTAPVSVVMFDKNFNYVLATEKWIVENGLAEYNIVGKPYQEICINYPAHWFEILKKCLKDGVAEKRKQERMIFGKPNNEDAEIKWVNWEFKPWYNNEKSIQGVIMLIEDITQRKYEADMLKFAKQKAEEASQAKHLFLANVSHEIRTPLHVMGGMIQLIQKTELNNYQNQYISTIKSALDNLLVIVNDILDMSKIEAGKITLENVGFNLQNVIYHLCSLLKHRAEEKGVGLFYEVDKKIASVLLGDPVRLNQILMNFVNNAIKFTNKGTVEIECQLLGNFLNENNIPTQKIIFRIIDTGKGIAENKLQQIFEKFTQEDNSINREYGGTGLGLSIAKNLAELMGGKIQVQSKRSIGTTFWFELEFPIGNETQIPQKIKIDTSLNQLKDMKVLLAEDHDINRFLATTILQNWGVKVDVAENGREAVDKVAQNQYENQYDVVLMDIQMPIMGGIEATRIIRQQLKSDVPIIALTAHAFKGERERYISAGMNDYVSKPFEADELYTAILHFRKPTAQASAPSNTKYDAILENNNLPNNISETTNSETETTNPQNNLEENLQIQNPKIDNIQDMNKDEYAFDLDVLRKALNYDEPMTQKMLDMFVEKTPKTIEELQQNLQQHNREQVKAISHKLKSSFKLLGMTSLADIALFLELNAPQIDLATLQDNVKKLVHIFEVIVDKISNKK